MSLVSKTVLVAPDGDYRSALVEHLDRDESCGRVWLCSSLQGGWNPNARNSRIEDMVPM